MRHLLLIILLFPIFGFVQTSKQDKQFQKALSLYNGQEYEKCTQLLTRSLKKEPQWQNGYLLLADCFASLHRKKDEIDILETLINKIQTPDHRVYKRLASLYYKAYQFDRSLHFIDQYLKQEQKTKYRHSALSLKNYIQVAQQMYNDSLPIQMQTIPKAWQGRGDRYFVQLSANDSLAVFTVRHQQSTSYKQEDFFFSQKEATGWNQAKPLLGNLNTPLNEGAHCLSSNGNWLIFTACGRRDGYGRCDLYFSQKINGQWTAATNLGRPLNSSAWDSQPTLSPDMKTLYFISNRAGGCGGKDIWSANIIGLNQQGVPLFSLPKNLGKTINTPQNEMSPFIHFDNTHLYFSSQGHKNMGGLDLFRSKLLNNHWQTPENLGYPINTVNDESGFFINAKANTAWLTSNKGGQLLSLYHFPIPKAIAPLPTAYAHGQVTDTKGNSLSTQIVVQNTTTNNTDTLYSNNIGKFSICLPAQNNYGLTINREGYLFYSHRFEFAKVEDGITDCFLNVVLQPIEQGSTTIMRNVLFAFNSSTLHPESYQELDHILLLMKQNPKLKVEIGGHTDNQGDASYNQKLSKQRAQSVVKYLIDKGVDSSRLESRGYGNTLPVASNSTSKGRAQNRRTELKILSN